MPLLKGVGVEDRIAAKIAASHDLFPPILTKSDVGLLHFSGISGADQVFEFSLLVVLKFKDGDH